MKKFMVLLVLCFSGIVNAQSQCGLNTLGGVDIFPWGSASPFLWSNIQGLWKIKDDNSLVFKFKVTRVSTSSKQLTVEIFNPKLGKCDKPTMTGFGIINASEKNIVRLSVKDSAGKNSLLTLAWFNLDQLNVVGTNCNPDVLIASMISLTDDTSFNEYAPEQNDDPKMMLKKITGTLDFYCKKRK